MTTPWFPSSVKPARKGVYQTRLCIMPGVALCGWSFWNGKHWGGQFGTAQETDNGRGYGEQDKSWRGRVSPTSRKAPAAAVAVTPPAGRSLGPAAVGGGTL